MNTHKNSSNTYCNGVVKPGEFSSEENEKTVSNSIKPGPAKTNGDKKSGSESKCDRTVTTITTSESASVSGNEPLKESNKRYQCEICWAPFQDERHFLFHMSLVHPTTSRFY